MRIAEKFTPFGGMRYPQSPSGRRFARGALHPRGTIFMSAARWVPPRVWGNPMNRFTPGRIFKSRGRQYEILGLKDHWCRDGRFVEMIRYQSVCAEPGCRRTFQALSTKSRARKGQLNKRCELHHAPGVPAPVKKVRNKRPKTRLKKPTAAARLAARRERAVQRAILAVQRVQRPSYLD